MAPAWVHLAGAVAAVAGMAMTIYLLRNRMPLSPRQVRQQNRFTTPLIGVVFAILAAVNWGNGQKSVAVLLAVAALFMLIAFFLTHLRSPRPAEEQQNFAVDRQRCGRCEYDLTGNVSGVCPECGWEIPRGELDIDSPGWAFWWRKWEIERLRNWRKTAVSLGVMILLFVALGGVFIYLSGWGAVIMPAVMSLSFAINLWRVLAYGRRRGPIPTEAGGRGR